MNLFEYLFSFRGRINRAKQWAIILVTLGFEVVIVTVIAALVNLGEIEKQMVGKATTFAEVMALGQVRTALIAVGLIFLVMLYVDLAITTKRLHDRNKSAWWLLVFFFGPFLLNIPAMMQAFTMFSHMDEMVRAAQAHLPPPDYGAQSPLATLTNGAATLLSLWGFVELYCLKGTDGPNRYGPDPLSVGGPVVVADGSLQH